MANRTMKRFMLTLAAVALAAMLLASPAWSDNVALNKTVTLIGTFYGAAAGTVVDGYLMGEAVHWQNNTVWWYGTSPTIEIDLGGSYQIDIFIVQADNNDTYRVSYLDAGVWKSAWEVPAYGGPGMRTRPIQYLVTPIITTALQFQATGGDNCYSVSEIQAYGQLAPVPPAIMLLGSGVLGLLGWRRFRKD